MDEKGLSALHGKQRSAARPLRGGCRGRTSTSLPRRSNLKFRCAGEVWSAVTVVDQKELPGGKASLSRVGDQVANLLACGGVLQVSCCSPRPRRLCDSMVRSLGGVGCPRRRYIARSGCSAESVALVGFGLDSLVDGAVSVILVWRFRHERLSTRSVEELERRAARVVGVALALIAVYLAVRGVAALAEGAGPTE